MTRTYRIMALGVINSFVGTAIILFALNANMHFINFALILGTLCATMGYTVYRFITE